MDDACFICSNLFCYQAPLLDPAIDRVALHSTIPFKKGFTSIIVGGHSSVCRWYSEDAVTLVDNIKVGKTKKKKRGREAKPP